MYYFSFTAVTPPQSHPQVTPKNHQSPFQVTLMGWKEVDLQLNLLQNRCISNW